MPEPVFHGFKTEQNTIVSRIELQFFNCLLQHSTSYYLSRKFLQHEKKYSALYFRYLFRIPALFSNFCSRWNSERQLDTGGFSLSDSGKHSDSKRTNINY